jgi:hypothetical protein
MLALRQFAWPINSNLTEEPRMRRLCITIVFAGTCVSSSSAADFAPPVRLKVGDKPIRIESPGFAAPCWADLHGDGKMHLLVGQFRDGKIQIFRHLGQEQFAPGEWLKADGEIAQVPGVY